MNNDCTFTSNTATSSGGAIFWTYSQVTNLTSGATYTNNTADLYGNNYGCFAQKLVSISESEYNSATGSTRRNMGTVSGTTSLTVSDQRSGGALGSIYIALQDEFDQIVRFDSTSSATVNLESGQAVNNINPVLSGTTNRVFSNGVIHFDDISFIGYPNNDFSLFISNTGIDANKPSNQDYLSSSTNTSMAISITTRSCDDGEVFLSANGE